MCAMFSYEPRTGRLVGRAAGQHFSLLTQHAPSAVPRRKREGDAVINWRKEGEVRLGKWTPWDVSFEMPSHHGPAPRSLHLDVLTEVDRLHIAARGIHTMNGCLRARQAAIMLAEDDEGAHLVHGWPPCRSSYCLVILHRFAELIQAVALENASRPCPRRR
jgi:hypothetical protein